MDDLDLLKELPGRVDQLDEAAKDRMRTQMEERLTPTPVRRPRRGVKVGLFGIAAVLAVGSVAAAVAIHPWTDDRPVSISAEGNGWAGIPDPDGGIASREALMAAVAEFAPAIRLPEGGSFEAWAQAYGARDPGQDDQVAAYRSGVVIDMVWVSQCQWAQQWLDASAQGDQAEARLALQTLGEINEWKQIAVSEDPSWWAGISDQMKSGDRTGIQFWETQCAYTGSWGSTPAEQDAKATIHLTPAIRTAQAYLRSGGDAGAFDPSTARPLAPSIEWSDSTVQPMPAWPGYIFIAPSAGPWVTLLSVSEAGTQFCAVVTDTDVTHGTTNHDLSVVAADHGDGAQAAYPGPLTCTPGGW